METFNTVSGGTTSAYVAVHYPASVNIFALVRIEDPACRYPDPKLRQIVEDKLQAPFVGTAEDDTIIQTILELEQFIGKEITWVTGPTFDEIVRESKYGGNLPNLHRRYCTHYLKVLPVFYHWVQHYSDPVEVRFGFRANEQHRAKRMLDKANSDGLLVQKATIERYTSGRYKGKQKWEHFAWQQPSFPLIADGVFKDQIINYWSGKPVTFAPFNNCIGCFHRHPIMAAQMFDSHPAKMAWFERQEGGNNQYWRKDYPLNELRNHNSQIALDFSEFSECDSGYCEL